MADHPATGLIRHFFTESGERKMDATDRGSLCSLRGEQQHSLAGEKIAGREVETVKRISLFTAMKDEDELRKKIEAVEQKNRALRDVMSSPGKRKVIVVSEGRCPP